MSLEKEDIETIDNKIKEAGETWTNQLTEKMKELIPKEEKEKKEEKKEETKTETIPIPEKPKSNIQIEKEDNPPIIKEDSSWTKFLKAIW